MKIDGVELVPGNRVLIRKNGHWSNRVWWRPRTWRRTWIETAQNGIWVVVPSEYER